MLPQMATVRRARDKFMVHLPPLLPPHVAHLLGKVGEDLGTDPIQPLDDFSLEQTHGDRCRPAQEAWGSKRGQLSQGGVHTHSPRAPDQWQGGTGTGLNADWAAGGGGGPGKTMPSAW